MGGIRAEGQGLPPVREVPVVEEQHDQGFGELPRLPVEAEPDRSAQHGHQVRPLGFQPSDRVAVRCVGDGEGRVPY